MSSYASSAARSAASALSGGVFFSRAGGGGGKAAKEHAAGTPEGKLQAATVVAQLRARKLKEKSRTAGEIIDLFDEK